MLSKNQIKLITSLKIKKYREEYGLFCAEGLKIVSELLTQNKFNIESLFGTEEWISSNFENLSSKNIEANTITQSELDRISQLKSANQVLAVIKIGESNISNIDVNEELVLVLDEIKDPGNMGTIIRIADWFGIKSIVCSENTVDIYNSKVIQSTMGSFLRVNVYYSSIIDFLHKNKSKSKIYGAFLDGTPIYQEKLSRNGILVIGNESNGISKELVNMIDYKLKIPSFSTNKVLAESLNASIATAIICSEFRRNNI